MDVLIEQWAGVGRAAGHGAGHGAPTRACTDQQRESRADTGQAADRAQLETKLRAIQREIELTREVVSPKGNTRQSR